MSLQPSDEPARCLNPMDGEEESRRNCARLIARGKFLFAGETKFLVRGVTYGTFRPQANGCEYGDRSQVEEDFRLMASNGINSIRTYTVPPRWMLNSAQEFGLRVMVGLPWEQHVTFLSDTRTPRLIEQRIRAGIRACAGHPAVLCYAIGNEIPAPIARWHGSRRIENFVKRLYLSAKEEDPESLVTYVNYPSTEYLQLPFLDLVCFNVYLESQPALASYLKRLQNLADDRPLLMGEVGLDSRRHGTITQAKTLGWEIRTAMEAGCAGLFVFSWTDEWHRGGHDIEDWDFGLTTRDREPKPALAAVREAFCETPFAKETEWPRISVIVCTHNGARTLGECLAALESLDYPKYEVIVVNDGSTDGTTVVASKYNCRVINIENGGLSAARNVGLAAATGEIVVYIDDDAYPDSDWLTFLASGFIHSAHAAIGGPNLPPKEDGVLAECVANAPGGPVHVLLTDTIAEHVPGCNMAVRTERLKEIGGFDPQFRVAGDDVDVCWRLQQCGWTIGYAPAAVVWHHRRNSIRAYWKQQLGYGKAEALLERKWPEKYNSVGHIKWSGRLYGKGLCFPFGRTQRIYHGIWGSAPFQPLHGDEPHFLWATMSMPEWYLIIAGLFACSGLGFLWPKLFFLLPLSACAALVTLLQVWISTAEAEFAVPPSQRGKRLQLRLLTAYLHLIQPLARLLGRVRYGLTAWRERPTPGLALPVPRHVTLWSTQWRASEAWVKALETCLKSEGAIVLHGGDYSSWDLEVRTGMLGAVRVWTVTEEHGNGEQLIRVRTRPIWHPIGSLLLAMFGLAAGFAVLDKAWEVAAVFGAMVLLLAARKLRQCAAATGAVLKCAKQLKH